MARARHAPATMLVGRADECLSLARLLSNLRTGRSGVLVLRGEAGVGKSALLDYVASHSEGCRVLNARGIESEMELPFAGLHQLCLAVLDGLDRLPAPQRAALETAFGSSAGPQPERFLIGLATLSLLAAAAEQEPLICLVDDAHWLDQSSAQVVSFVARRLQMESVLLLIAERDPIGSEFAELPDLLLRGLSDSDARSLLMSAIPGPIDEAVRDRIVAECRGNPLALLELPRDPSSSGFASGFATPEETPLPHQIETSFLRQVASLPRESQQLILVAAAEPLGDPTLLWRAASDLDIPADAAGALESAGLLGFGARINFRHPLLRSAVYRYASPEERRRTHRALTVATDSIRDPDRRAWHAALATIGANESVATDLESSAGRAQLRGGYAAEAAFLERAVALTFDPAKRARRALAAAQAKHQAGAHDAALALLAIAAADSLDEHQQARVELLRGQIAFNAHESPEAPLLLLGAAKRLESLDRDLSEDAYLDAFAAAIWIGNNEGAREVARAVPITNRPTRPVELLLAGWKELATNGFPAGTDLLKQALVTLRVQPVSHDEELRWLWFACRLARNFLDLESWRALCERYVRAARDTGALTELPTAVGWLGCVHEAMGELDAAAAMFEEAETIARATRSRPLDGRFALDTTILRAGKAEAMAQLEKFARRAAELEDAPMIVAARHSRAALLISLGRYHEALAEEIATNEQFATTFSLGDLIEAAVRSGEHDRAYVAFESLRQRTQLSGTDWALGLEARARALLSDSDSAEGSYQDAISHLDRTGARLDLARARLLYGEWLRRENRRIDAREQLRAAHEMFSVMGASSFRERAARELAATGERARRRRPDTRDQLTAQELQIAQLAAEGCTNPQIAAQLYISPHTVEYHLTKVFAKLAIKSRTQLDQALSKSTPAAPSVGVLSRNDARR